VAEPPGLRCAPESLARREPLIATASRVQRWMIVEQPGAWGVDALAESKLDPDTATALAETARAQGVRVLLARRRANQRRLGATRTVFLAHSGAERWWLEQVDVDAADPKALLALDLARADPRGSGPTDPTGCGTADTGPADTNHAESGATGSGPARTGPAGSGPTASGQARTGLTHAEGSAEER